MTRTREYLSAPEIAEESERRFQGQMEEVMPDVIEFLERLGRDASLRHAPLGVLEQALRDAQIEPQLRAALMRGDQAAVEAVLGANNVCCMIFAPSPDSEEEESDESRRHAAA